MQYKSASFNGKKFMVRTDMERKELLNWCALYGICPRTYIRIGCISICESERSLKKRLTAAMYAQFK